MMAIGGRGFRGESEVRSAGEWSTGMVKEEVRSGGEWRKWNFPESRREGRCQVENSSKS